MRLSRCLSGAGLGLLAAGALYAQHHDSASDKASPRLGKAEFPTSAPPAAQAEFMKGLLYLHSFEYQAAERAFRAAEALAPDFAMAYWGEAMTYNHGVWNEQDLSSARGALERLGPTAEARRAKTGTERERGYLAAVEALYGEGTKPGRDTLYAAAMERVVRENPSDLEAKAFYALALLGLNQGVRDTSTYLRAAPWADTVFRANPNHPGGAHYLIHAYDDPIHASLGLAAARAYSRIAPDAAHAQHMTTHIFMALGMWDDVVAQNEIAVGLTAASPGHYTSWLLYGLLEQGRYEAAERLLGEVRGNLSGTLRGQYTELARMRAHYLLQAENWRSTVFGWKLDPDRMTLLGQITEVYADGVIAYRRRDPARLTRAASEVGRLVEAQGTDRAHGDPELGQAQVMAKELGGMLLFLSDRRDEAVRVLREATAIEDALPMEFGPPAIIEPSHEVLGTMLLEMRPLEARREFERALVLAPGRSRALIGLTRSAIAVADKPAAAAAMDRLTANWRRSDPRVRDAVLPLRHVVERMP
jgi:tetratricopeptide (TPR) repeat protein